MDCRFGNHSCIQWCFLVFSSWSVSRGNRPPFGWTWLWVGAAAGDPLVTVVGRGPKATPGENVLESSLACRNFFKLGLAWAAVPSVSQACLCLAQDPKPGVCVTRQDSQQSFPYGAIGPCFFPDTNLFQLYLRTVMSVISPLLCFTGNSNPAGTFCQLTEGARGISVSLLPQPFFPSLSSLLWCYNRLHFWHSNAIFDPLVSLIVPAVQHRTKTLMTLPSCSG